MCISLFSDDLLSEFVGFRDNTLSSTFKVAQVQLMLKSKVIVKMKLHMLKSIPHITRLKIIYQMRKTMN